LLNCSEGGGSREGTRRSTCSRSWCRCTNTCMGRAPAPCACVCECHAWRHTRHVGHPAMRRSVVATQYGAAMQMQHSAVQHSVGQPCKCNTVVMQHLARAHAAAHAVAIASTTQPVGSTMASQGAWCTTVVPPRHCAYQASIRLPRVLISKALSQSYRRGCLSGTTGAPPVMSSDLAVRSRTQR
jgi:hypothetical protein